MTIAGGTLELPTPAVTQDVPNPITPLDMVVDSAPPYITLSDDFSVNYSEGDEVAKLVNLMFQNGNSNATELRNLLDKVTEELKPLVMEAIALLESGYQNAINTIIE
jgi:hypothetical protein